MCLLRADLRAVTRMERDMTRSRTDAEDGETLEEGGCVTLKQTCASSFKLLRKKSLRINWH